MNPSYPLIIRLLYIINFRSATFFNVERFCNLVFVCARVCLCYVRVSAQYHLQSGFLSATEVKTSVHCTHSFPLPYTTTKCFPLLINFPNGFWPKKWSFFASLLRFSPRKPASQRISILVKLQHPQWPTNDK